MRRLLWALERLLRLRCRECLGAGFVDGLGGDGEIWSVICPWCRPAEAEKEARREHDFACLEAYGQASTVAQTRASRSSARGR